jgi:soluble lytic murein transglycosylase-like protein
MSKVFQVARWEVLVVLLTMAALPCRAASSAVLRNGFSIRYERRQDMGLITRLYVNPDGSSFVDVPTAEIDHIEAAPDESAPVIKTRTDQSSNLSPTSNVSTKQAVDVNELVASVSGTYRLDPDLVNSVIRAESGFNVRAVSPKGAQGLMQLMPQTASHLGIQNAFDPQANVEGGTRYLRELLERYNFDLIKALAAYNAGPERVEQYGGVPPYYETKAYVARIVRDFNRKKLAQKGRTPAHASPKASAANKSLARASGKPNPAQSTSQRTGLQSDASNAASR